MKKLVSFMLVAAMVVATLTGCGSSDNAKSTEAAGESLQAQHLRLVVSAL